MTTYQHINVTAKPYPLAQIVNDLKPDAITPTQALINTEFRMAMSAPELFRQLRAMTNLVETMVLQSGRTDYLPLTDAAHALIAKIRGV